MDQLSQKEMYTAGGVIAAILFVLAVWWFYFRKPKTAAAADSATTGKVIIYGSLGCPYTLKQMNKYPDHEFVDCTTGKCPSFVTAYPTTKMPDGKIEVGFS